MGYKNREDMLAYHKQYNLKNKEKLTKQKKEYYEKNREEIIKKQIKYQKENKVRINGYNKKYLKERYKEFKEKWYSNLKCKDCGTLENIGYHHVDSNTKLCWISDMYYGFSDSDIQTEIDKCIPLCQPCHMVLHNKERM